MTQQLTAAAIALLSATVLLIGPAQPRTLGPDAPPHPAVSASTEATASPEATARGQMRFPLEGRPAVVERFRAPAAQWGPGHRGVDLSAGAPSAPGAPVYAPADGVVTVAQHIVNRDVLVIAHSGGLRSSLEPVRTDLAVGDRVGQGQQVGIVADDQHSHCSPACLHWGVRDADVYIDPLGLISRSRIVLLPVGR